jgi:hypothetical protein
MDDALALHLPPAFRARALGPLRRGGPPVPLGTAHGLPAVPGVRAHHATVWWEDGALVVMAEQGAVHVLRADTPGPPQPLGLRGTVQVGDLVVLGDRDGLALRVGATLSPAPGEPKAVAPAAEAAPRVLAPPAPAVRAITPFLQRLRRHAIGAALAAGWGLAAGQSLRLQAAHEVAAAATLDHASCEARADVTDSRVPALVAAVWGDPAPPSPLPAFDEALTVALAAGALPPPDAPARAAATRGLEQAGASAPVAALIAEAAAMAAPARRDRTAWGLARSEHGPACTRGPFALEHVAAWRLGLEPAADAALGADALAGLAGQPAQATLDALRSAFAAQRVRREGDPGPWRSAGAAAVKTARVWPSATCFTAVGPDGRDAPASAARAILRALGDAAAGLPPPRSPGWHRDRVLAWHLLSAPDVGGRPWAPGFDVAEALTALQGADAAAAAHVVAAAAAQLASVTRARCDTALDRPDHDAFAACAILTARARVDG